MAALLMTPSGQPSSHWPVGVALAARASSLDSRADSRQRDRWVAALIAAYAFSPDQIKQLARTIYAARLAAYITAYTHAVRVAGGAIGHDWQPDDATLKQIAAAALAAAQTIAATYQDDLRSAATQAVDAWLKPSPTAASASAGVPRQVAHDMKTWADGRAQWKAQQVGQYETGRATQQAAQDAHDDLVNGDWADASGDPLLDLLATLYVAILPEASSLDECAAYAGQVFRFDDAPSLDFPLHPNCIHTAVFLTAADLGDDAASME